MRNRLEDLGRLSILIKNLAEHELFDDSLYGRPKDFLDWWETLDQEKKDDWLHATAYRIQNVQFAIYDMLSIAEGSDPLNEPTHCSACQKKMM